MGSEMCIRDRYNHRLFCMGAPDAWPGSFPSAGGMEMKDSSFVSLCEFPASQQVSFVWDAVLLKRDSERAAQTPPLSVRTQHPGLGARAHTYDTYRSQELRGGCKCPNRAGQGRPGSKIPQNHEFHQIS